MTRTNSSSWPDYRAVWRWHFYAGMFSIPFVLILSITGGIYLFKPQIEAWNDRPYENLTLANSAKPIAEQVRATLVAIPGSRFESVEMTAQNNDAGRILIRQNGQSVRCYVHPATLELLYQVPTESKLVNVVKRIHGELLIGPTGSYLVELAACWTIVMILTGLFLWWPRKFNGLAGVLYPRLWSGTKPFWRDVHSVTGVWISGFALILVLTGLPWAGFWGNYLKAIRSWTGTATARQDWSVGVETTATGNGGHESHRTGGASSTRPKNDFNLAEIDRVVATTRPLRLAHPVIISPPTTSGGGWSVKSNSGNRQLRDSLTVVGATGEIVSREGFEDRHVIDQIVSTGISLHEGQLFGGINQAIGLITVLGLMLLSASGIVLWWRRRHTGLLGAPKSNMRTHNSPILWVLIVALALYLPVFGASLLVVLTIERLVLRRLPVASRWLGLASV